MPARTPALGRIFCVMLKDLEEKQVAKVSEINTGLGGNREVLKKKILPPDYPGQATRWA